MKYCIKQSDVPKVDHYAIVSFSTMYIPGDERSYTNPGHGYPGHSEPISTYQSFDNYVEWEAEIEKRTLNGDKNFVAFQALIADVKMEISVSTTKPKLNI